MRALPVCRVNGYFRGEMRYIGKGVQCVLNRAKYHGAVIQRDAVQVPVLTRVKREADVVACCQDSLDALRARCVACRAELLERPSATFESLWCQRGGKGGAGVNFRCLGIPFHVQIPMLMGAH